jgi:hypothetical protein
VLRGTFGAVLAWYKARGGAAAARPRRKCATAAQRSRSRLLQTMLGTDSGTWRRSGGAAAVPWALVSPVREPVAHYLSWFYYFAEPDNHMSIEQWATTGGGANGLAAEFGLRTADDVQRFVDSMAWGCASSLRHRSARAVLVPAPG